MNANRPLLVVTPTLGRSPWLNRTVISVATYAGASANHVLVAPTERLDELARIYPQCTLVADTVAQGIYPAINQGLAHARGQAWGWFTWINDDDELTPGFARHLARALRHDGRRADAPWCYGQVQLQNGETESLGRLAVARWPSDIVPLARAGVNPLNQQGTLAPRSWVDRGGPLAEEFRICADVDFWLRAAVAGARFRCSPETVAVFRLHAGQISGDIARHRAEFLQVARRLAGPARAGLAQWLALARFRLGNAGVYADRFQRCGLRGGFALLEQPDHKPS